MTILMECTFNLMQDLRMTEEVEFVLGNHKAVKKINDIKYMILNDS